MINHRLAAVCVIAALLSGCEQPAGLRVSPTPTPAPVLAADQAAASLGILSSLEYQAARAQMAAHLAGVRPALPAPNPGAPADVAALLSKWAPRAQAAGLRGAPEVANDMAAELKAGAAAAEPAPSW